MGLRTPTCLCPSFAGRATSHGSVQNARPGSNSCTASTHPERSRPLPFLTTIHASAGVRNNNLMSPEEFREAGHRLVDWIADYRAKVAEFPVMARTAPGEIRA